MGDSLHALTAFDLIGLLGATLIVVAYAMLQLARWGADHYLYLACNLLGASLILVSLVDANNVPSAVIESFWALISLARIVQRLRLRR